MSDQGSEPQPASTQLQPETDPDPNLDQPSNPQIGSQEPESQPETSPENEIEPEAQPTYAPIQTQESLQLEQEPESKPEQANAGDEANAGDQATGEAIPVEEKKGEVNRTLTMRELLDELKTEEQGEDPAAATPRRWFS